MEVREMVEAGNIDASQIAQSEHANALNIIKNSVREIERANPIEEIEEEIELEETKSKKTSELEQEIEKEE